MSLLLASPYPQVLLLLTPPCPHRCPHCYLLHIPKDALIVNLSLSPQAEKRQREHEAEERHESMMSQWKMWQQRIAQQHEFDDLMYKFHEQKHMYMYLVTMEVLKFCKCTDFTQELGRYFMHDVSSGEGGRGERLVFRFI